MQYLFQVDLKPIGPQDLYGRPVLQIGGSAGNNDIHAFETGSDCRVLVDAVDPNLLTLVQTWETRADLARHVRSDRYRTVLAIMESSEKRPEVAFRTISKTEGLEAIENLREPGA